MAELVDAEDRGATQVIVVIKGTCLSTSKHPDLLKTLSLSIPFSNLYQKEGERHLGITTRSKGKEGRLFTETETTLCVSDRQR